MYQGMFPYGPAVTGMPTEAPDPDAAAMPRRHPGTPPASGPASLSFLFKTRVPSPCYAGPGGGYEHTECTERTRRCRHHEKDRRIRILVPGCIFRDSVGAVLLITWVLQPRRNGAGGTV